MSKDKRKVGGSMSDKMKRNIKRVLIITGILCFLLFIATIIVLNNDNLRFKLEYESLNRIPYENGRKIPVSIPWNNSIQYIEGKEILETFQTKSGIVYFGYNSCPWCRNVIGLVIETAKENQIKPIYYVDIHHAIDDVKEDLKEYLDEYLRVDDETGEKVLAVPDVYFLKDGKIIGHHISTVKSYKNPYKGMNNEQKQELKEIYQEIIEEMKK